MIIKAAIVDDEQHCSDRLAGLVARYCGQQIYIAGVFDSYESAIEGLPVLNPGLVFMDVQLRDRTGFEVLKGLAHFDFDVIFTTAYERFAVQAFKFSAIDYLLKPIDPDELLEAVGRCIRKPVNANPDETLETLFHNFTNSQNKRIVLPVLNGLEFVPVQDIIRCQSDGNYTTFFLKDLRTLTVSKTLKEYEDLLSDSSFYRVHNSHMINLNYVKSYNRGKGGFVVMTDRSEIEVSTRRKEGFLKWVSDK